MKEKEIYFCSERRLIGIEAQRNFSSSEVLHSSDFCHEVRIISSFWKLCFHLNEAPSAADVVTGPRMIACCVFLTPWK